MNCEKVMAGWFWRQRRRLRRRRVLVVGCVLSCLVGVQLLAWCLSDRWLNDASSTTHDVHSRSRRAITSTTSTGVLEEPSDAWLDVVCKNRMSFIATRTQLNVNISVSSSRRFAATVSHNSSLVHLASRDQNTTLGRNERLTFATVDNSSRSLSSLYSHTLTTVSGPQDAAIWRRHLLAVTIDNNNATTSPSSLGDNVSTSMSAGDEWNSSSSAPSVGKSYPDDLFTDEQLHSGAVILHAIGTVYMFVGLAIVCDEYFIPALEVITARLRVTEDVAGATLMAAGGSAPELFTSVIGVFVAHSDVGIGTIVGSAVFNVVFVIGACSMASAHALSLSWWPLCRDVTFYCTSLLCLIACFLDQLIHWWEAMVLLTCYIAYVTFMAYNQTIENLVKKLFNRKRIASSCDLAFITQVCSAEIFIEIFS